MIIFEETNGDYIVLHDGQRIGVVIPIENTWSFGSDYEHGEIDNLKVLITAPNWQAIIREWIEQQMEVATIHLEDSGHGPMVVVKGEQRVGFVYFRHNVRTDTNWWEFRQGDFYPVELTGIIPTKGLSNVKFLERIRRSIETYLSELPN